ncbi:MAG: Asp-tRNA(Asn)/Glu-tRNA(Gln) amidotransferase subunit GatC, partial [Planctomycetota bacterium]|jgi:aspartyl-tRNA(Asn)/glutamyl-tRNA(Gln) amidotransferase subunit C
MSNETPALSHEEVRKVARLARLDLHEVELESYREQLATVLGHVARLRLVDVEGVEPMAHPGELSNRLDRDEPTAPMEASEVLRLAPTVEGPFLSVPKVL